MSPDSVLFRREPPTILVVDQFYKDPAAIRQLALAASYEADLRFYKGLRSTDRFLFPYVKEEFERLLGLRIVDWLAQPANGSFQKTIASDPLVWHSDTQSYAAAIYLTPTSAVCGPEFGTSFWRHAELDQRRPSPDPTINAELYSEFNLLHPDNWELVDRVGSVFNRLVLWDAQLIHSATTYEGFTLEFPRLVQLFFFNVER